MLLKPNSTLLFIGDSVTDYGCGRGEDMGLGTGYPLLIAGELNARYPSWGLRVINRGIGGNRVRDLQARWQEDCLRFQPDIVSVLIGVNDTWRRFDCNDPTSPEAFEAAYRDILCRTKDTGARIVMMEPFLLTYGTDHKKAWLGDFAEKVHVVRELAAEFADVYVPLDGIMYAAGVQAESSRFAADGIHPSVEGHGIIARCWIDAVTRD